MTSPLVTTEWLAAHLTDPDLRIIDIRGHVLPADLPPPHYFNHEADYLQSHIPGALFVDWVHEITDPDSAYHAQIAPPDRFAAVMNRVGIRPGTFVVAYDDADSMFAARLWWALYYYGHEKVAVLDGGWKKWLVENRPTTAEIIRPAAGNFVPQVNRSVYRNGDDVMGLINSTTHLVDVRSLAEFAGQSSRTSRKGHIPGALNLPRPQLVSPDGTMPPPEKLKQQFAQLGIHETDEVVTYCNAGVSASYGLLALRAAGFMHSSIYDGSWKDWSYDETRPIE